MKNHAWKLIATASILAAFQVLAEEEKKAGSGPRATEDMEEAARLQVFLDRAQFAPGKIDGRYGQFTMKALALYREAQGGQKAAPAKEDEINPDGETNPDAVPEVSDLDLASVDPLFITYTVTEADLEHVGELPAAVAEQAKRDAMPYRSVAEAIAEKFHTDAEFLEELNPGKTEALKAGDTLRVPNVEPFELGGVKDLISDPEADPDADAEGADAPAEDADAEAKEAPVTTTSVKIDTTTSMLRVYDDGKLIAAYPVTVGSEQTESPTGDWKVTEVSIMPNFRHDKAMLKRGERSDDFNLLPPGPNNPVGVIWIQLNKKGIGLHGTDAPDTIGRAASHGCVRLANWDVVRLVEKIGAGVPVEIQSGPPQE